MGTQSKIGSPTTFSGRHGRWIRRRRRLLWLNRPRIRQWGVPVVREEHPNAHRKDVPHVGAKQKRKALNRTRVMAGMKSI